MKIVILGNTRLNYSWFCLTFRQGCKLLGHDVYDIDYKSTSINIIKQKLLDINPKYVFTHLSFHKNINPIDKILQMYSEVKKRGINIIHTCSDARTEDRYMKDLSESVYMAFVGTFDMVNNCSKAWNIPTFYCPYSSLTYDKMAQPVKDLMFENPVFTGSPGSHDDRKNFIEKLQRKMKLEIFHTQSPGDLRSRTEELSSSAKCILGLCTGYDIDGYIDVRPFQYLGAGAFMIIRKFKGMDDIIPDDIYIPFNGYTDSDVDFVKEKFEYWKNQDTSEIRIRAFNYIQRNHSSKIRIKNIIDVLEEKRDSVL